MSTYLEPSRRVILYPEQLNAINHLLDLLVEKLGARLVFLTQVSGQMLAFRSTEHAGQTLDVDALGALIAGDLAASREIARVTGAYEECQLILRQGQQQHSLIAEVGETCALFVQVSHQVPLGWVRMVTLETARQLAELLQPMNTPAPEWSVESDALTHLVNDSLDSLWTEDPDVR
jgi:predicted regulator of Ras-like GTPase activity (Roadblock/LC7/MglB family)